MFKKKLFVLIAVLIGSLALIQAATINTGSTSPRAYFWKSSGTHANTETSNLLCGGVTCLAGSYLVSADIGVLTASAAGSATLTITANDGVTSRTMGLTAVNLATTSAGATSVGLFELAAASTFTSGLVVSGGTGSGTFYENVSFIKVR